MPEICLATDAWPAPAPGGAMSAGLGVLLAPLFFCCARGARRLSRDRRGDVLCGSTRLDRSSRCGVVVSVWESAEAGKGGEPRGVSSEEQGGRSRRRVGDSRERPPGALSSRSRTTQQERRLVGSLSQQRHLHCYRPRTQAPPPPRLFPLCDVSFGETLSVSKKKKLDSPAVGAGAAHGNQSQAKHRAAPQSVGSISAGAEKPAIDPV